MISLASEESCTGCSACKAICPRSAIAMVADEAGFLRPVVNHAQCVQCHACEGVCPVLHPQPAAERQTCYAARTRDAATLQTSASGGLFPELAKPILAAGGVVFGCVWKPETMLARHVKAESPEELRAMQGTKYLQSDLEETFREAKSALLEGRPVLFSGTPCQIAGLRAFLGKPYERLLTVEIICHSVPSPAIWKRYLTELHLPGMPTFVSFREKAHGGTWRAGNFVVRDKRGNVLFRQRYRKTLFARLFLSVSQPGCFQCTAKGGASGADLTIGDLWGLEHFLPAWNDGRGASLVIVHTEQGARSLPETIDLLPVEAEQCLGINRHYRYPAPTPPNRREQLQQLLTTRHFTALGHRIAQTPLRERLRYRAHVLVEYVRRRLFVRS